MTQESDIISLNQESSINQLIGNPVFLENIEAKRFYLQYICRICKIPDKSKYEILFQDNNIISN